MGVVVPAQQPKTGPPPALPFFEWNRCPFEGCVYRKWKAEAPIALFSTWKTSRRKIGTLATGDTVVALTGVVITFKPGVVRLDRDLPARDPNDADLRAGDTILTYAYHGEGEATAWTKGRFYQSFDISFTTWPDGSGCQRDCAAKYVDIGRHDWWAKVRLRNGRTAWVLMDDANFSGVDRFG